MYEKITAALRELPGQFSGAARRAGVHKRTVKKAWEDGWPERGLAPIRNILDEEQRAARARLAALRERELQDISSQQIHNENKQAARVVEDAILQREEEAKMVRGSRHAAMALLGIVQRLEKAGLQLAERVESRIAMAELSPKEAASIFRDITSMTKSAIEAAHTAQAMERSLLGEPEKIIGVALNVSASDAAHEMDMANRALARMRRKGLIIEAVPEDEEGDGFELPDESPDDLVAKRTKSMGGGLEVDLDPSPYGQ